MRSQVLYKGVSDTTARTDSHSAIVSAAGALQHLSACLLKHSQGNAAKCAISLDCVRPHVRTPDSCERICVKLGVLVIEVS